MRYRISNSLRDIEPLMGILSALSREQGFSAELAHDLRLVLEEALSNVILYGFQDESEHLIEVDMAVEGEAFVLEIRDDGIPFNPLAETDPNLDMPIEEREIGGLGIYLTRTLMDELTYVREGQQNVLRMKKRIASA